MISSQSPFTSTNFVSLLQESTKEHHHSEITFKLSSIGSRNAKKFEKPNKPKSKLKLRKIKGLKKSKSPQWPLKALFLSTTNNLSSHHWQMESLLNRISFFQTTQIQVIPEVVNFLLKESTIFYHLKSLK